MQFLADGRWVAYVSNESGKNEIYVRPFRFRARNFRFPPAVAMQAPMAKVGTESFYVAADQMLMASPR